MKSGEQKSETSVANVPRIIRFEDLSPSRKRIVTNMRRFGYGYIEGLHIRDCEPIFDPLPQFISTHKTRSEPSQFSTQMHESAALKKQHLDFLAEFDLRKTFEFRRVNFSEGLPVFWEIVEAWV